MLIPRPTTITGWLGYGLGSVAGVTGALAGLIRLANPVPITGYDIFFIITILAVAPLLYVMTALYITPARRGWWNHLWALVSYPIAVVWGATAAGYIWKGLTLPAVWLLVYGLGLLLPCLMLIYLTMRLQMATWGRR